MPLPLRRVAFALRLLGVLVLSPLQGLAYVVVTGSAIYGLVLSYVPLAAGWIGLINRPLRQAIGESDAGNYEFSAKGAIVGMIATFAVLLAFAPAGADRTKVVAVFLAGSLAYYAIGKFGCIAIGCCRATEPFAVRLPLPLVEGVTGAMLGGLAFASTYGASALRLLTFAVVTLAFLSLRLFSRLARGESAGQALRQPDSLALFTVVVCTALTAVMASR